MRIDEEGEVRKLIKVWALVIISLCYCYSVGKWIEKGMKRLLLLIPVIFLFLLAPLHLSTAHLIGTTAFFISWLANFKLSLFAFGKGPLNPNPPLSLHNFLLLSCFPIKIQLYPKSTEKVSREGSLFSALKALLLLLLITTFNYTNQLPDNALLLLYGFTMYFSLDLILSLTASLVRAASNLELEPQFNEPYLATSLQDFWGRRWNLMVSEILRPTVYEPLLRLPLFSRKWASAWAAFGTFVVSGIMHELIFFYLGRLRPSWRLMSFFVLHGFCTMAEIALKKAVKSRWKIPTTVGRILTVVFVVTTGVWLFFPEFKRCGIDEKAFEEYAAVGAFLGKLTQRVRKYSRWPQSASSISSSPSYF